MIPVGQNEILSCFAGIPAVLKILHKLFLAIICKKFHPGKAGSFFCTAEILLCRDKIFLVIASACLSGWKTLACDSQVLYGNVALSFVVLWTKKQYSSFLRKVLVFQKTCFKVKVLKTFNNPQCHIKTYQSLKKRAILKIHITVF